MEKNRRKAADLAAHFRLQESLEEAERQLEKTRSVLKQYKIVNSKVEINNIIKGYNE